MCEWGELYNFLRTKDIGIIIPRRQENRFTFIEFGNAINGRWTDLTEGIDVYDIISMENVNIVCPCRSGAPGCANHIVSAQTMHTWLSTQPPGYPYNNKCPKCRAPLDVVEIMSLEQLRLRKDALAKEPALVQNVERVAGETKSASNQVQAAREAVQPFNEETVAIEHAAAVKMGEIAMGAAEKQAAIERQIEETKKQYNKKKRNFKEEKTIAGRIKRFRGDLARDITVKLKF